MSKKLYCIDFRNMHTAIHGLICFNTRAEAEANYKKLSEGIGGLEKQYRNHIITDDEYTSYYNNLITLIEYDASRWLDEVNYREFENIIRYNKPCKVYQNDYVIVNNIAIDLYI